MDECSICGISGEYVVLYDAISEEGIIKICSKCSKNEHIPIIRKPTNFQLKESERKHTVYERLSKASGFKPRKEEFISKEDTTLKEIVDKNYMNRVKGEVRKNRPDLVDNFYWIIMRARRLKHLSQKQLALEIGEPEKAIIMAEKGILPEDGYKLISKLQSYLNVRLVKKSSEDEIKKMSSGLSFDPFSTKEITLGELKEQMPQQENLLEARPKKGFFSKIKDFFTLEDDFQSNDDLSLDKEDSPVERDLKENLMRRTQMAKPQKNSDIAKKDIDDLIFGKKK